MKRQPSTAAMGSPASLTHKLQVNPRLRALDKDVLQEMMKNCRLLNVAPDEIIYRQGDAANNIVLVADGVVKVCAETQRGHLSVLELVEPGGLIGIEDALTEGVHATAARAVEHATILLLPLPALQHALAEYPQLASTLLSITAGRVRLMQLMRDYTNVDSTRLRLLHYLMDNHYLTSNGTRAFELPAPKYVVASLLHMKPETFSRALRDLRDLGVVGASGRLLWIADVAAAEQLLITPDGGGPLQYVRQPSPPAAASA